MATERVAGFVADYRDLVRNSANEEELRTAFNAAAISQLGIRDLKFERVRQDVRRNRIIIEFYEEVSTSRRPNLCRALL